MIRLLIGIVVALGLALAPAAAEAGVAEASNASACAMGSGMPDKPDMPANRLKMVSCTVACQIPPSAAFLPAKQMPIRVETPGAANLSWGAELQLMSLAGSALDPPPRA